jgi:hypothetical protein
MSEQTEKAPQPKPTVEQLRAGIQQTRAELGETVQALAAKADVKARAREQVEVARERALETVRINQAPIAIVAVGAMAVVGIILVLRGRRR